MTAVAPARTPLLDRLHRFADELRARGLPVSLSERIDAMRAVEGVALDAPNSLHTVLSATLVKAPEHLGIFDEVFDLYFRLGSAPPAPTDHEVGEDAVGQTPLDLEHALRTVLRDGSEALARLVAEQAVAQFAGFERGRPVAGVLYESRTLRGMQLERLAAAVAAEGEGDAGGAGPSGSPSIGRQLGFGLAQDQIADRAELVRQQVREVIRELLVADRGVDAVAKTLRTPLPADVAIAMASAAQLEQLQRIMRPLERKLATTMMRKRRHKKGPLDVRATLRSSMATGGVPVRVVHRRPNPTKPQLYVLADMSGSVATFAAFTITLVSATSQLFSRLRTFAFVENAVEITDLMRANDDPVQAVRAINTMGGLHFLDASTDYGRALRQFSHEVSPELTRRSTVLIFGDGRGNYRPSEEATLAHVAKRAGAVYWLNPERTSQWGSGDSLMNVYARHCTEAVSCRTLNDLRHFVEALD